MYCKADYIICAFDPQLFGILSYTELPKSVLSTLFDVHEPLFPNMDTAILSGNKDNCSRYVLVLQNL